MDRRNFFSSLGGLTAAARLSRFAGLAALVPSSRLTASVIGPLDPDQRRTAAFQMRYQAAAYHRDLPPVEIQTNGDDALYPNKIASFSKALPHNDLGEVDLNAYQALMSALTSGRYADFEKIAMGGGAKLTDPMAAFSFGMEGQDSHQMAVRVPPAFSSAEEAGEMAELYWQALTRDVPFSEYDSNPLIQLAAADLTSLSDFRGPKVNGQVTTRTLFRGPTGGDLSGPYISQYLWKDVPYGATPLTQRYRTPVSGVDYMSDYQSWLAIQRGGLTQANQYDSTFRYLRNGRDLAEHVHFDAPFYQHFVNASLILLSYGSAAIGPDNVYANSTTQAGFATFGAPNMLDWIARAANEALQCAWFQKWLVHRRLRPEAFAGRIHNHIRGAANYPIHADILNSAAVQAVASARGTYLLPMAFPEGSPSHPAYCAGHATSAGACATMMKAFFNEDFVLPDPVVASADGLRLDPYTGPPVTAGGEINKLAANIGIGRNTAGVHWRTDATESLKLGEAVAIGMLRDLTGMYTEDFGGFSFTKFDGTRITVCPSC